MRWTIWGAAVFGAGLGVIAAAAIAQQNGLRSTYWLTATTALPAGGRGPPVKTLAVQLGSQRGPAGPLLGVLEVGSRGRQANSETGFAVDPEAAVIAAARKQGRRLLVYRGCADRAPAGQPYVLDFRPKSQHVFSLATARRRAGGFSPLRPTAFSGWRETRPVALGARAAGPPPTDPEGMRLASQAAVAAPFMPPPDLRIEDRSKSAGVRLSWRPVPGATAYQLFLEALPASAAPRSDLVFWTSAETDPLSQRHEGAGAIGAEDAARLVDRRALLGPQTRSCAAPAEATAFGGRVEIRAYGQETVVSPSPPFNGGSAARERLRQISWAETPLTSRATGSGARD